MRSALTVLMMALAATFSAQAGELDNEKAVTNEQMQLATDLPQTLVIRVNQTTNEVEVLHTNEKLSADEASKAELASAQFVKMDVKAGMAGGELDRDSSRSSWYFCWPTFRWAYPTYYYYGYTFNYANYYNFSWGSYNYYYYRWSW